MGAYMLKFWIRQILSETKGELATTRQQFIDLPKLQRRQTSPAANPKPTSLSIPSAPHSLVREDYPDVPFWTKKQWLTYLEGEKNANRIPNRNGYLTTSSGEPMLKERATRLREDAKVVFNSLFYFSLDPDTWGKKFDDAANYVYNSLCAKYEELQFCENNWKVQTWVTDNYPDWMKNNRKAGGLKRFVNIFFS